MRRKMSFFMICPPRILLIDFYFFKCVEAAQVQNILSNLDVLQLNNTHTMISTLECYFS